MELSSCSDHAGQSDCVTLDTCSEPDSQYNSKAFRLFWPFVIMFASLLTLVPYLSQPSFRIDILHQFSLSRECVAGTYMFPAFSTWLLRGVCMITNEGLYSPYLAAAVLTLLSIWGVWRLGSEYMPKNIAFFGALSLCAYWYFNSGCVLYNNNGAMTFFMIYGILFFHYALKTNRILFWIGAGASLGLCLICKYTGIIPITTVVLYMVVNSRARRYWSGIGPYLSILTAILIFIPNGLFLLEHREEILAYVASKKSQGTVETFIWNFVTGWLTQCAIVLPVVLVLLPLFKGAQRIQKASNTSEEPDAIQSDRMFLPFMFLCPFLIQMVLQCLSGVAFHQDSYGYHLWPLLGIFLLSCYQIKITRLGERWFFILLIGFTIGELCPIPIHNYNSNYYSTHSSPRRFPGRELAGKLDEIWSHCHPHHPLRTVSTDFSDGSEGYQWHASVYSRYKPSANAPLLGAWCSDEEVVNRGGLVLWRASSELDSVIPESLVKRFPSARFVQVLTLRYRQLSPEIPPLLIGVGIIDPGNLSPSKSRNGIEQ